MSEKLPAPREGLSGKAMRRVVMGSFAGALMEWYDFFIFGTAAGLVFAPLFYPDSDPFIGLIAAFATFGVGFLTRPLGGIVFGHFGDKIGRKITLIWTLAIVGCSTDAVDGRSDQTCCELVCQGRLDTWQGTVLGISCSQPPITSRCCQCSLTLVLRYFN